MKLTKRADRWYDENGNSWITEELATTYSPTLTNCYNCRDCSSCSNCSSCINCSYCSDCINCNSCRSCSRCSACYNCIGCKGCKQSIELDFKKNYKPQPIKSKKKNKIAKIRQEYNINDRKLELEL
jgi:hypothetical protein